MRILKVLLPILFLSLSFSAFSQSEVRVIIKGITEAKGKIEVGLYDGPKYWLEETGQFAFDIIDCTSAPEQVYVFKNVPKGTYAFSLYHDINGNNEMDFRTWIPKEPFGFSNNPKAKWSKPKFETCSFEVGDGVKTIVVDLHFW